MAPARTLRMLALGGIAAAAFAIGLMSSDPAAAQSVARKPGFVGSTPSTVAGCPFIVWYLARDPDGHIHGIAFYSDLAGVSEVAGQRNADGNFTLSVTPTTMGAGPSGTVTGHSSENGALRARLVGPGCANAVAMIKPMANMNAGSCVDWNGGVCDSYR